MNIFLQSLDVVLQDGFMYSILAMGYYISYTILDFPDLTVEGTVLSGGITFGLLVRAGMNPWIAMLAAFAVGFIFGALTGVLHVKLKIRPLLCGILVSTGLISVNLVTTVVGMGGNFAGDGALSTSDNEKYVSMLAKNAGNSKILGLAIGNAYAAVSGALIVQSRGNVNQGMGVGMIVIGLASLIIGLSVFGRIRFMKPTTMVIIGSVIYQGCLGIALVLGVPSAYNKIIMAVLFTLALVFSSKVKKGGVKRA